MSTALTFNPLVGGGVGGAMQDGDPFRAVEVEQIRQALNMALYNSGGDDLGGSDVVGLRTAGWVPVVGVHPFTADGDSLDGLDLDILAWSRTAAAGTSVQLRLRNTTDSTDAALGTAITATTRTAEVLTAILASGPKVYQLEILGGNADDAIYGDGVKRFRKVPV